MEPFIELTLSNGEAEVMVHVSPDALVDPISKIRTARKVLGLYAFKRDVDSGYFPPSWKWVRVPGRNPLFVHLTSPSPATAKRALHARGFSAGEDS